MSREKATTGGFVISLTTRRAAPTTTSWMAQLQRMEAQWLWLLLWWWLWMLPVSSAIISITVLCSSRVLNKRFCAVGEAVAWLCPDRALDRPDLARYSPCLVHGFSFDSGPRNPENHGGLNNNKYSVTNPWRLSTNPTDQRALQATRTPRNTPMDQS